VASFATTVEVDVKVGDDSTAAPAFTPPSILLLIFLLVLKHDKRNRVPFRSMVAYLPS
jgi:hypothetical protein